MHLLFDGSKYCKYGHLHVNTPLPLVSLQTVLCVMVWHILLVDVFVHDWLKVWACWHAEPFQKYSSFTILGQTQNETLELYWHVDRWDDDKHIRPEALSHSS